MTIEKGEKRGEFFHWKNIITEDDMMTLGDAESWVAIVGGIIGFLVLFAGLVYWMTAMFLNGRASTKAINKLDKRMKAMSGRMRKHFKESDVLHNSFGMRLDEHENRIGTLEEGAITHP